jgi:hypothetical protein
MGGAQGSGRGMMPRISLDNPHLPTWIGGVLAVAVAALDLFWAHSLPKDTDLVLLVAGLGAFGISGAFAAGKGV